MYLNAKSAKLVLEVRVEAAVVPLGRHEVAVVVAVAEQGRVEEHEAAELWLQPVAVVVHAAVVPVAEAVLEAMAEAVAVAWRDPARDRRVVVALQLRSRLRVRVRPVAVVVDVAGVEVVAEGNGN